MARKQASKISIVLALFLITTCVFSFSAASDIGKHPERDSSQTTHIVNSTAESGDGTLTQALEIAQAGDTITFDPSVFPKNAPATIFLTSRLPGMSSGNLTLDADNAGVILDGKNIASELPCGLMVNSDGNIIRGLQVQNFHEGISLINCTGNIIENNIIGKNAKGIALLVVKSADTNAGTYHNTIRDNYIGIDAHGNDLGNQIGGVSIEDGCTDNTIGPGNIITNSGKFGIWVFGADTSGNIITENNIYNNYYGGIWLMNNLTTYPAVTDFDLNAGTIKGMGSANAVIEIFSDENNEGKVFEGRTTADENGFFKFSKGSAFHGPHLTATVTCANGSSQFSVPTSGSSKMGLLQSGNHAPRAVLIPKKSEELTDNRISNLMCLHRTLIPTLDSEIDRWAAQLNQVGMKRSKVSIDFLDGTDVEQTGEYSKYYIPPLAERYIDRLLESGIDIIYILNFWDEEIKDTAYQPGFSRFKTEAEIQRYLDYVEFIVNHFSRKITSYALFNEPNNYCPIQYIKLEDYINVIKRVIPVIKSECPNAKIFSGNMIFSDWPDSSPITYTKGLFGSEAAPLLDGLIWEYFYDDSPEFHPDWYYNYPSNCKELKDLAEANGFKGEYIAGDFVWSLDRCPFQSWTPRHIYSETAVQKYQSRVVLESLGMDIGLGISESPFRNSVQNICTLMSGAKPASLSVKIESTATNIRSYGFSLPNGDYLLALWTDGVLAENDPGVEAHLTLQGFFGRDVTGIDVLNGFEQDMITVSSQENMLINDLLVKDYPIILRIAASSTYYVEASGSCGGKSPCYRTIEGAIGALSTKTTLKISQGTYLEDLTLNTSKELTISGGWDVTFTKQTSTSTLQSIIIKNGRIVVENLVIQ